MRTRTRLIGLLATLILLGIVIGLPATLLALGATPIPRSLPTLDQLRSAVTTPDDGTLALGAIKVIAWASWIILTGSGDAEGDALSLGEKHGRALFILEERVKERLGLTVAPVIVRQVGQRLELQEIRLDSKGRQMP